MGKGESGVERKARRAQAKADRAAGIVPRRRGKTRLSDQDKVALPPALIPATKYSSDTIDRALVMRAQGLPLDTIGRALRVPAMTISRWCREPGNAAAIAKTRGAMRQATLDAAEQMTARALDEAKRDLEHKRDIAADPAADDRTISQTVRDIEIMVRAAWNLERIGASASGETVARKRGETARRDVRIITPDWWRVEAPSDVPPALAPSEPAP